MFFVSAVMRSTLTAGPELDLVPGDRRPPGEAGDLRVDAELVEHLRQGVHHDVVGLGARLRRPPAGAARSAAACRAGRVAGQHELLPGLRQRGRRRVAHDHRGLAGLLVRRDIVRRRGHGILARAEAERLNQAVAAAVLSGLRRPLELLLAALLVLLEQRRVVGLGVLARLDGRAQPDLPGDLDRRARRTTPVPAS